jgi:hypothetical protein
MSAATSGCSIQNATFFALFFLAVYTYMSQNKNEVSGDHLENRLQNNNSQHLHWRKRYKLTYLNASPYDLAPNPKPQNSVQMKKNDTTLKDKKFKLQAFKDRSTTIINVLSHDNLIIMRVYYRPDLNQLEVIACFSEQGEYTFFFLSVNPKPEKVPIIKHILHTIYALFKNLQNQQGDWDKLFMRIPKDPDPLEWIIVSPTDAAILQENNFRKLKIIINFVREMGGLIKCCNSNDIKYNNTANEKILKEKEDEQCPDEDASKIKCYPGVLKYSKPEPTGKLQNEQSKIQNT